MAASGLLGQWYIELLARGNDDVADVLYELEDLMDDLEFKNKKFLENQKKRNEVLVISYGKLGKAISAQMVAASVAVVGLARAGYQGTVQGQALSVRFQQLSREIAATLLPYTDRLTDYMGRLVMWFRRLDGEGQKLIGTMIGLGVAIKAALSGHPILALVTGLMSVVMASKEGSEAFEKMLKILGQLGKLIGPALRGAVDGIEAGLSRVVPVLDRILDRMTAWLHSQLDVNAAQREGQQQQIGFWNALGISAEAFFRRVIGGQNMAAAGFGAAMNFGFDQQRRRDQQGREGHRDMLPAGGSFEGVAESFRRLQVAAIREDIPTRQLAALDEINRQLAQQGGILGQMFALHQRNLAPQPNAVQP